MPHSQEQTTIVNDTFVDDDLSFLDEIDAIIDGELLAERQEVIDGGDEDLLLSVISEAESDEEMAALYQAQEEVVETVEVVQVEGEPVVMLEAAESAELAEKVVVKAAKERKSRASKPSERIISRLGTDAIDYTTLTPDWGLKSPTEHSDDFAKAVDSMALYVSDKAVNLFAYLKTGGGLNEVTRRGFEVLLRDGQLVGGDNGNIIQNLLTKPYGITTARSQASQLLQLFTGLEIGVRSSKGVIVANADSVILERVKTLLGK